MASIGNQHCANCIGALSVPIQIMESFNGRPSVVLLLVWLSFLKKTFGLGFGQDGCPF